MPSAPRILISTGEPSGDLHAGAVALALRERIPGTRIEALGGPVLVASGATLRFSTSRQAVLGFAEILSSIPRHLQMLHDLERDFREGRFDLLIAVDYPGFNLRLAERARRHRIPVLYYIAPKHWATRSRLTPRFARAVSRVACIVPFEPAFFAPYGIPAEYVGHPLLDRPTPPSRREARRSLGIPENARVLALFPGSRRQEVARLWGPFRDAAKALLRAGHCDRVFVATMPGMRYPGPGPLELQEDRTEHLLAAADAAIVKSGTATLEAALAGVPMVVAYRMHPVTAWVARRLIAVRWVSMVNLIANRSVVPELLQEEVNPARLAGGILGPLLSPDHPDAVAQRVGFREVREKLGGPGASRRVAEIAAELVRRGR